MTDSQQRNSTICELTFPTTVLAVRLNRKRLVVVLEDQIYLYDISNMKLVHTIDTSPNPLGKTGLAFSKQRRTALLNRLRALCVVAILRQLLHGVSTAHTSVSIVCASIARTAHLTSPRADERACHDIQCHHHGSHQCHRSTPSAAFLHDHEQ